MGLTLLTRESRRRLRESDRQWYIKFSLRTFTALLALIGMSAMAAAIPPWNAHFFHAQGLTQGDWQDGLIIAPFVLSIVHYFVTTFYLFRDKRPVLPAINIGVDLLIWAMLIPAVVFSAWGGLFNVWRPAIKNDEGETVCDIFNVLSRQCSPILYSVGGLELAGVVLGCIVWLCHVTLFVWAILDFLKQRKLAKRSRYQSFNFELETQARPSLQVPDYLAKEIEVAKPVQAAAKQDKD